MNPLGIAVLAAATLGAASSAADLRAFPGAEGWGAESVGGRGGAVIRVTTLANDGPGSLREALLTPTPRIVVFAVGGTIELDQPIDLRGEQYSHLTLAGQTAPGGGIQIKQGPNGISDALLVFGERVHDVVIRYLRLRSFSGNGEDGIKFLGRQMIMDHVSVAFADDENISIYRSSSEEGNPAHRGITIQRTLSAYGWGGHSNGLLISGSHAPQEQTLMLREITVWRNLFASNSHRNPRVTSGTGDPADGGTEVINNVVYNWHNRIGSTTRQSVSDWVNNYYKVGPDRMQDSSFPLLQHDPHQSTASIYSAGNAVEGILEPSGTDWDGLWTLHAGGDLPAAFRRHSPLAASSQPPPLLSAVAAYADVLSDVGANARLDCAGNLVANQDSLDQQILDEVATGTGPDDVKANDPNQIGWPTLAPGSPCPDADGDGMPDAFEGLLGSDPAVADAQGDLDGDGYTNIEEYLNGTPLPPPSPVPGSSAAGRAMLAASFLWLGRWGLRPRRMPRAHRVRAIWCPRQDSNLGRTV